MKKTLFALLCATALLSAAPTESESWTDQLFSWFTELFVAAYAEPLPNVQAVPVEATETVSPDAVALLSAIPRSDTVAITSNWPYLSADAGQDVARRERLLEQTVLLTNPTGSLPFSGLSAIRIVYPSGKRPDRLIEMARRFTSVQAVAFTDVLAPALAAAPSIPTVVIADDPLGGVDAGDLWYRSLYGYAGMTLVHFGDVSLIDRVPASWSVLVCPVRAKESEAFVAQVLFGAQAITGRSDRPILDFGVDSGISLPQQRPGFREPELLKVDREQLEQLDQTINRAIRYRATPGAQLAVLRGGQVIYERAYGKQSYGSGRPVTPGDLYDLASVTKVAATSLAIMKLYDEGRIDLTAKLSEYLPEFKRTAPGRYTIAQLLAHHTGMQANLPLYPYVGANYLVPGGQEGSVRLSTNRWLDGSVPGHIRRDLRKIDRTRRPMYRYSDVNYVLLQFVVEAITGTGLDAYVKETFYEPLGLTHLTFNPIADHPARQLVPTITDKWMDRGVLRGFVHDEGAAMMGGVAGHAGLFGNARDLGILFQFLLDGGEFNGRQIISREAVALFTARNPFNHRALGFDRLSSGYKSVIAAGASEASFGHTGFTGTCVWADPENNLVFVLLTNRIHPDPANKKLLKYGTRSKMQRDLYRALNSFGNEPA
ncbi:CubicO group peptidase (beta-lactamase class C family) [Lewinella aquimaris]|uniref:CubicO group peptidase (Beta-lactamase class C family) n=1 Tax=Neolewinella aquimaris TaxID=1835722 RepID=A0A840DXI6_9BACT|nr:serine hydrolase [Neolewinella aquimaris]MBB4077924.1 CubicO group peptidase (beta-lactamase class C family) [Neolewinella aquimaris]